MMVIGVLSLGKAPIKKPKYPKIRSKKDNEIAALALAAMAPAPSNPWNAGSANPIDDIRDLAAKMNGPRQFTQEEWDAMSPQEQNKEALRRLRDYNDGGVSKSDYWNPTELFVTPNQFKELKDTLIKKEIDWTLNPVNGATLHVDEITIKKVPESSGMPANKSLMLSRGPESPKCPNCGKNHPILDVWDCIG